MNELLPQFNTGILIKDPEPTDYIRGTNSPITAEKVNPSGDWSPYIPTPEDQYDPKNQYDTMNCTGFSLTNIVEMWLHYYIQSGRMPVGHMQFLQDNGYFDANGKVDLSERALGVMAGTGPNGNYLQTVAQAARKFGLAPNKAWPWDGQATNIKEYYKPFPDSVWQIASKFRDYFEIQYHWFFAGVNAIPDALKESPLWVALATCPGWGNPPVPWCGVSEANHAVTLIKEDLKTNPLIFDHYSPYIKQLALNYVIPYLMQVFVVIKETKEMITLQKTPDGTFYLNLNGKSSIGIGDMNAAQIFSDTGIAPEDVPSVPTQTHTLASGIILHKVEKK